MDIAGRTGLERRVKPNGTFVDPRLVLGHGLRDRILELYVLILYARAPDVRKAHLSGAKVVDNHLVGVRPHCHLDL